MKKSQRKFINRIINKAYSVTKSSKLQLALLNGATRMFKNGENHIEFDPKNNTYWLKKGTKYLMPAEQPYFDFSEKEMYQRCVNIFCKHCTLEQGDTVIDIGAGVGTEVCYFTDQIGTAGNLYNLEASPSSYKTLSILTEKNKLTNSHNFNMAISNSEEPIWMEEGDNYVVNAVNKEAKGIMIPAITLDQFVIDNKIKSIKLLKVNIEGAEFDMIDGMKEAVHCIDNVAISCHDFLFDKGTKIQDKVVTFLEANQFDVFYENTGNKVLDSWIYGKKRTS